MDFVDWATTKLGWLPPRCVAVLERWLRASRQVQQRIESETAETVSQLEGSLKPYRETFPSFSAIPPTGRSRDEVLAELLEFHAREQARWHDGRVSGAVYHGDTAHIDFLSQVYAAQSQSNPLHADLWPSTTKFEAEIVAMTADMLGRGQADSHSSADEQICGTVTSGGTESILLAMKTYRDWCRAKRGVKRPEMVLPTSAHVAFDKAAHYFQIKPVRVPVGADMRADVERTRRAIGRNTIVVVGSAPGFPHGVIDPIEQLAALAQQRGVGFHTDACLGGFVLPWARQLGYDIPPFDFRVPGVTSMSADTHKYGYAAKGTSVVLYRGAELRRHQYFTAADWPGGLYYSPTLSGSRPGALSAACWAAMTTIGQAGYLEATRQVLVAAKTIRRGIEAIDQLDVLGDPLWVIAFGAHQLDIYKVLDAMTRRGWSLNGLHKPAALHICVTLRHAQPGVAERFVEDLRAAVAEVREQPDDPGQMAPVYGMAASLPFRGVVRDMLKAHLDMLYKV